MEKGLTRAEFFNLFPQIVNKLLDGSTETQYMAFIRNLSLKTEILTDAQMVSYLLWCLDNNRTVDYTIDGITETGIKLVPEPEQEMQWHDDFKMTTYLEVKLCEGVARTAWVR